MEKCFIFWTRYDNYLIMIFDYCLVGLLNTLTHLYLYPIWCPLYSSALYIL